MRYFAYVRGGVTGCIWRQNGRVLQLYLDPEGIFVGRKLQVPTEFRRMVYSRLAILIGILFFRTSSASACPKIRCRVSNPVTTWPKAVNP